jgi:Ca2+-binding RTX toxin-like protein
MLQRGHLITVVRAFLIGCAVLLVVSCAGVRSEAPQEEQRRTEVTKEQTHSDRCEGTRTLNLQGVSYATNDVPGCPKGGLLSGTDGQDNLAGMDGDDKIRGLGDQDALFGGPGNDFLAGAPNNREEGRYKSNDVLYGGPGSDVLHGGAGADFLYSYSQSGGGLQGKDVLYGGDGNDTILADDYDKQDKLYCGEGWDRYIADKGDFVSSSCEKKWDGTVS